ncbi:MAG: serine/threonine protein kinase [Deltaproteobacteria bacterium]|nr:serine/threonine protein kinase [Deltaproteobacteria bacterium]
MVATASHEVNEPQATDDPREPGAQAAAGRYRILRRLASGGMGEVFLAESLGAHGVVKRVAIKRILPRAGDRGKTLFVEEARTALALSHANIVQVFDFGVLGDEHVLVMEYVDGVDLQRLLGTMPSERLPPQVALYVAIETLKGLAHAQGRVDDAGHPLRIVHCDIKPSNLLCSRDGEVKIADFGIAKAAFQAHDLGVRRLAGTAGYMSPEQAWGEPLDARADVFSVGAVLYRALSGATPYDARSFTAVRMNVDDARLPPLDPGLAMPAELDSVLRRALARERSDRFETPGAMLGTLEDLAHRAGILLSARTLAALVRAEVDGASEAAGGSRRAAGAVRGPDGLDGIVRQRARAIAGAGSTEPFSEGTNIVLSKIEDGTIEVRIVDPIPAPRAAGAAAAGRRPQRSWIVLALVFGALSGTVAALATRMVRERPAERSAGASPTIVALSTSPSGASLEVDGRPIGTSPTVREVAPGSHRLRATSPGFLAAERTVEVASGSRLAVHVPLSPEMPSAPPPPAQERGSSRPPEAAGTIPRSKAESRSGGAQRFGSLSVSSDPWARITIDGRPTGLTTPAAAIRLPAGNHTVELHNSIVGARKRFTVRIGPGEDVRRMVKLR